MTNIHLNQDARDRMAQGINKIAKIVCQTMGPYGRNVFVETEVGIGKSTRDGVTVAHCVHLPDPLEALGASLAKQVAQNTVVATGDGTTGSIALFDSLITHGLPVINSGYNPNVLSQEIKSAATRVLEQLQAISAPVQNNEQIYQVAQVSTNGDAPLARIVADAFAAVKTTGTITLLDAPHGATETTLRVVPGFEIAQGYAHRAFITERASQQTKFILPLIWLANGNLFSPAHVKDMHAVLSYALKLQKSLVIIAPDISEVALEFCVLNALGRAPTATDPGLPPIKIAAIKTGGFGLLSRAALEDLACFTGATLRDSVLGDEVFRNISPTELGTCASITIGAQKTILTQSDSLKAELLSQIEMLATQSTTADTQLERHLAAKRLALLDGGIAQILVGGQTDLDQIERKMRLEDAIGACKAAIANGVVAGGGSALLKAREILLAEGAPSPGARLVYDACAAPYTHIMTNTGAFTPENLLLTRIQVSNQAYNMGYNAATMVLEDLISAGIIDATLTIQSALKNAVSVAALFLTTGGTITNDRPDRTTPST